MTSRQGSFLRHARLSVADWLVGGGVTIADIACYPYVSLAPEGSRIVTALSRGTELAGTFGGLAGLGSAAI